MIAAEKDRQVAVAGHLMRACGQRFGPGGDGGEVAQAVVGRSRRGEVAGAGVAQVGDVPAQLGQRFGQAGGAEGGGAHHAAGLRGAFLDRRAKYPAAAGHVSSSRLGFGWRHSARDGWRDEEGDLRKPAAILRKTKGLRAL